MSEKHIYGTVRGTQVYDPRDGELLTPREQHLLDLAEKRAEERLQEVIERLNRHGRI